MTPLPVCAVLDNPPDGFLDDDIDENLQNITIIASSSESDDENSPVDDGYQLLPQEAEQDGEENDNVLPQTTLADENNILTFPQPQQHNVMSLLPQSPSGSQPPSETVTLWNETENRGNQQPMDDDHVEKIKAAMSGFTLPAAAVPTWATVIPEEEWKTRLFENIHARNPSSFADDNCQSQNR